MLKVYQPLGKAPHKAKRLKMRKIVSHYIADLAYGAIYRPMYIFILSVGVHQLYILWLFVIRKRMHFVLQFNEA
jgi:hypothetical protein